MVDGVSFQIAACMNASSGLVHHSNEPDLPADPERVVNVQKSVILPGFSRLWPDVVSCLGATAAEYLSYFLVPVQNYTDLSLKGTKQTR